MTRETFWFLGLFAVAATATFAADDRIVTGAGSGGPHVQTFRLEPGNPQGIREASFFAYDPAFRGGVTVAGGIQGSTRLVVTGPASGGAPHVRIFDVTDPSDVRVVGGFLAYEREFRGGVSVALADVDGDGWLEVVTGPGPGRGPLVRVFDISVDPFAPDLYTELLPLPNTEFQGGVRVAPAGPHSGGGTGHVGIVTVAGPGPSKNPYRIWDLSDPDSPRQGDSGSIPLLNKGGWFVAGGDITGDGSVDFAAAKGSAGEPDPDDWRDVRDPAVWVYPLDEACDENVCGRRPGPTFHAYHPSFTGGVRVATADADGDGILDLITGAGPGGGPHVRAFRFTLPPGATHHDELEVEPTGLSFFAHPRTFRGGIFVGGFVEAPEQ